MSLQWHAGTYNHSQRWSVSPINLTCLFSDYERNAEFNKKPTEKMRAGDARDQGIRELLAGRWQQPTTPQQWGPLSITMYNNKTLCANLCNRFRKKSQYKMCWHDNIQTLGPLYLLPTSSPVKEPVSFSSATLRVRHSVATSLLFEGTYSLLLRAPVRGAGGSHQALPLPWC